MILNEIINKLEKAHIPQKREFYPRFFKTGKGEYGEGDKFFGTLMPDIRKISKDYKDLSFNDIEKLLQNEYHECRMFALLVLELQFKKADKNRREEIFNFYLAHTDRINNWDLVDITCKNIVGVFLSDKKDKSVLYELSKSKLLWDQRISIISTAAFIRENDFEDTLKLSEIFLIHKHDLMHKACGWMLREVGKKDKNTLINFLDSNYKKMPRTMLRYSLEKLSVEEKKYYMKKDLEKI